MMRPSGDLETLYRVHVQAVYRFALGLCRDRSQAEDIVSETFARIARRASRIESATALAYLLAVARNLFLDGKRRSARDVRARGEIANTPPEPAAPAADEARLAAALAALATLPEGERAALLLRLDHGLPYEQIAAALGISLAAAKVRVHRGRMRLVSARLHGDLDNEG